MKDPLFKAFLLSLDSSKQYSYDEMVIAAEAFVSGWDARDSFGSTPPLVQLSEQEVANGPHIAGISSPRKRTWSAETRAKFAATVAAKRKRKKK